MSLNRLLTRLAAVSALDNFHQEPWPTIAGPNVFDSKIEPVNDMPLDNAFPTCVVYTDYDKDHWNFGQKIHRDRLLTVTIELLIVTAERLNGEGEQLSFQLDCPLTDSEIETSLDMFEVQVFRALVAGNEASDCFAYLCPSYENTISRRGATIEGGQRLAARQITLEMKGIRDPVSGNIPGPVEAFLARLETQSDYAERVGDIRQMLTQPAALHPGDRLRQAIGYNNEVATRIGNSTGPAVLLPANLTYNFEGLNP